MTKTLGFTTCQEKLKSCTNMTFYITCIRVCMYRTSLANCFIFANIFIGDSLPQILNQEMSQLDDREP